MLANEYIFYKVIKQELHVQLLTGMKIEIESV
jgi:hypothetical protein